MCALHSRLSPACTPPLYYPPSYAEPLLHISNHLLSLGFADSPDYTLLRTLLLQLGDSLQQHLQQPQHQQAWQQQGQGAAAKSHAQPMMVDAGPSHEQVCAGQVLCLGSDGLPALVLTDAGSQQHGSTIHHQQFLLVIKLHAQQPQDALAL